MLKSEKRDGTPVAEAKEAASETATRAPGSDRSPQAAPAAAADAPDAASTTPEARTGAGETASPAGAASARALPSGAAADAVLAIFRNPEQHRAAMSATAPLPPGLGTFFATLADRVRVSVGTGEEGHEATSAAASEQATDEREQELVKAAVFFINRVLVVPGADHYRVLALTADASFDDIQRNYRNLRHLLRELSTEDASHAVVMRISEAYVVLRDPERRRRYDEEAGRRRLSAEAAVSGSFSADLGRSRPQAPRGAAPRRIVRAVLVICGLGGAVWLAMHWGGPAVEKRSASVPEGDSSAESSLPATPTPEVPSTVREALPTAPEPEHAPSLAAPAPGPDETTPATEAAGAAPIVEAPPIVTAVPGSPTSTPTPAAPAAVSPAPTQPASAPAVATAPAVTAAAGPAEQITKLLARAERQVGDGRLTMPAGDNARDTYREVLRLDPQNAAAQAGMGLIAERYVALGRYRLNRNELTEAAEMATRGLEVVPDSAALLALRDQIEERRVALAREQAALQEQRAAVPLPGGEATPEVAASAAPASAAQAPDVEAAAPPEAAPAAAPSVALPAPEPVAARPARPTILDAEGRITEEALQAFIQRFVDTYEQGDLAGFMALFTPDARTNNRGSRNEINDDYRSLFESSVSRVMRLKDLRWNRQGTEAFGEGDFSLSIVNRGESRPRAYEGRVTFQIVRQDADLLLRGLFHSQRKLAEQ